MVIALAAFAATLAAAQPTATADSVRIAVRDVGAAVAPGKLSARRCLWTATRPDGTRLEGSHPSACAEARQAIAAEVARLTR